MMNSYFKKIISWILSRLKAIPYRDSKYTIWYMIAFLIASMLVSIIYAIGNPTGVSFYAHFTNIGKVIGINGLAFFIWTFVSAALLSFLYIPLPRLFIGSFTYTIFVSILVLMIENSGNLFSFIVGISYGVLCLMITLFIVALFHQKKYRIVKLVVLSAVVISSYLIINILDSKSITYEIPAVNNKHWNIPFMENPSKKGDFSYIFLSYGSGDDKHREEYGEAVNITTPSVDASHFITRWGEKREAFWGFDQYQLPVNARVWLPDGEGPFPVILMVHGNHTMEDFSTGGYDYLGELFASRGFIAASVDEDFINYSNYSGIPNKNYELRAWMLLKHLVQLDDFNQTPGNPLYEKINLKQVGLIGHSRGGQAVSMVADFHRFFDDEHDKELLERMENIEIKGIVALAPTDKTIDGKRPHLEDVSFLLIQGAQDADINNFRGDRQFYRTSLQGNDSAFKSSLYIADANHSQFNTDWGRMDSSLPKGLFINKSQLMPAKDQRQIAKVYLSAFFERVFYNNKLYENLFRNYQYGLEWLPETVYVNKYQNASYSSLLEFKRNKRTTEDGVDVKLEGFNKSEIITPMDRKNSNRSQDAVLLEWKGEANYTINLTGDSLEKTNIKSKDFVVFTMANMNSEDENSPIPMIDIELETADGMSVKIPLHDFIGFPPVISTDFTPFGLFDDIFRNGKYDKSWEPVFQTFEIPFHSFEKENPSFDKSEINRVILHFHTNPGKILIESVGLSK